MILLIIMIAVIVALHFGVIGIKKYRHMKSEHDLVLNHTHEYVVREVKAALPKMNLLNKVWAIRTGLNSDDKRNMTLICKDIITEEEEVVASILTETAKHSDRYSYNKIIYKTIAETADYKPREMIKDINSIHVSNVVKKSKKYLADNQPPPEETFEIVEQ